jgi:hypothetical protein
MSGDSAASAEKAERHASRESRRSLEGRRRTPLRSIFPKVQHHQIGTAINDVAEELHEIAKDVAATKTVGSDGASMVSTNTTTSSMWVRRRSYGAYPILTIEEATSDGHGDIEGEQIDQDGSNLRRLDSGQKMKASATDVRIAPRESQAKGHS